MKPQMNKFTQQERNNWRDCPDCGIEMERKFSLPNTRDYEDSNDYSVFQCPDCKRIEEESCLVRTFEEKK